MGRTVLFLVAAWLLAGSVPAPAVGEAADAASLNDTLDRLDALYARRDDSEGARELEPLLQRALREAPGHYDVLWRAARQRQWEADGALDKRRKQVLGQEAWRLGERAAEARPDGVEGHYFAAIGIGNYSQAVGILKALSEGLEGKFCAHADKALALDADFDAGGPRLVKGRYHYELPWPKRSYRKATAYFQDTLRRFPSRLRAAYYLAETELAEGEEAAAQRTLEKLLQTPPSTDGAEDRRIRALAQTRLHTLTGGRP